ncbi:MAG: hypothetical protein IKT27_03855 [Clostridia bacterium]|nr:hypothetical protein [Clostridia bacterium]
MAVSLRDVLDEELNIETEELITDAVIKRMYNKALHWYRKYRLFPRTNTYNYSIESGDYVPDILMNQVVTVDGKTGKLSEFVETQTRVFNGTGTITVTIALNANNAYLAGLPEELENLFVAHCKIVIGQRLKFSKYPSQPIELDGPEMFAEGEKGVEYWKNFIMINRDCDPENITDLRNEAYTGIPKPYFFSGRRVW